MFRLLSTALLLALCGSPLASSDAPDPATAEALRPAGEFRSMSDKTERSRALFLEAAKVLTHPRCVNCHPSSDVPLQGDGGALHQPPVRRGRSGLGVAGMECKTCHQRENFDPGRVPGAPAWHLAPRKMAWEGLTVAEICGQLKDPERNGNRTLAKIVEHMTEDALVGWAWSPGADRAPAPGDQETFGELVAAWVKTGGACPD